MSGGVDSSVAAWLLREAGHEVCGVAMRLGISPAAGEEAAPVGPAAGADARIACEILDIPLYTLDAAADLEGLVIQPFLSAYLEGRTPNPCVECNRALKFGALLRRVQAMGCDFLATGHYARIAPGPAGPRLLRPRDLRKDQTYFLYAIDRQALGRILFPLALYTKEEVREMAAKAGLPGVERRESQDVCFLPGGDLASLLQRYGREGYGAGDIVTRQGKVLGRHRGLPFYTVGQRGGLGIGHRVPLYVLALDVPGNRLIVGEREETRATGLRAASLNLLVDAPPARATAKIRYAHRAAPCAVVWERDVLTVRFDSPQEAVTPGQSVVIYDGDLVVGGGIIQDAL